jgi:F-box interacting protein
MFKKALPTGMAGAVVPTHCDGLVALATANGRVCVCNPATGEFVALPPGARGSKGAAALCYDLWRHRYVVVRCFYRRYNEYKDAASGKRKLDYEIGHEVFTLGDSSSSWEPTADPPLAIGPADPVCTRDAVYWCTDDDDTLLRFSLRDRAFDVASGPPGAGSCCGNRTVTGLGGKLCYVACNRCTEGGYDVWVADADGRRLEWSLRCHVGIDQFGRPGVGEDALLPVFAAAGEDDEMILAADYKQVYCYGAGSVQEVVDLEEEMAQENPDGTPKIMVYHVLPYVESLVSLH